MTTHADENRMSIATLTRLPFYTTVTDLRKIVDYCCFVVSSRSNLSLVILRAVHIFRTKSRNA